MAPTPWAPEAAHVAAQFGIPKGIFLGLVHQESGFNPNAVSSAGARGLTQLMPATAKSLGVNIADPHSQLVGGAKYLKAQFDRFGNWKLALAAYNAGPGNVSDGAWQQIPETRNYVKSILGSVGKYGGIQPQAPVAPPLIAGTVPQVASPVLHGTAGLNTNAFAADEFAHLGDPGFALNNLAAGVYDTPFSAKLSALTAPKIAAPTAKTGGFAATSFKPGDPIPGSYQSSVGGEHPTAGLAGFPAHDYFAKAGALVVAPVGGTIVKLSGHDPQQGPTEGPHGPFGWSVYIKGTDGRTYFLTHLGSRTVQVGQTIKAGAALGTVGNYAKYGTPSHVHMGVNG